MTQDDKNSQIGAAMLEHQAAKTELGHIEQRLDLVFRTYREVGGTCDPRNSPVGYPTIQDGKMKLGLYVSLESKLSNLLNESELTTLAADRDKARTRLDQAKKTLERLGISL